MSTKLCYFFQQGKCNKGSNCAFIHNSITIEIDSSSLANSENYSDNESIISSNSSNISSLSTLSLNENFDKYCLNT